MPPPNFSPNSCGFCVPNCYAGPVPAIASISPRTISRTSHLWLNLERAALRSLDTFGSRFGPARRIPPHLRTGTRGEMEALFHLRQQNYTVIARRWRCTEERGDLDLVAWESATLCFIEVKTRTTPNLIPAEFAVDRDKERQLRAMARAFQRRMPRTPEPPQIRFDIVSVYAPNRERHLQPHPRRLPRPSTPPAPMNFSAVAGVLP